MFRSKLLNGDENNYVERALAHFQLLRSIIGIIKHSDRQFRISAARNETNISDIRSTKPHMKLTSIRISSVEKINKLTYLSGGTMRMCCCVMAKGRLHKNTARHTGSSYIIDASRVLSGCGELQSFTAAWISFSSLRSRYPCAQDQNRDATETSRTSMLRICQNTQTHQKELTN